MTPEPTTDAASTLQDPTPAAPLDLEAIERRAEYTRRGLGELAYDDIRALLAEVRRLTTDNSRLQVYRHHCATCTDWHVHGPRPLFDEHGPVPGWSYQVRSDQV